ncbi:MAG: electron transfer flavoprotein subunit beta/FixA family protein [Armatimonadota bacterium]|nr:electron transfer flavoprotein subunit beta/FixA family protein [Armatimonadota bacterium]
MHVVVVGKLVPDLVEDLEVDASGRGLDRQFLKLVLNEFDEHALEEAVLLKEAHGARVTVLAPEAEGVDDALYTALAKGADRAMKLVGLREAPSSRQIAAALASALPSLGFDLVLTGVQAADDLDGQVGMLLAGYLGLPHVGVVTGVELDPDGSRARVRKEYPGGWLAELEVQLPAVLGIQAAKQPPRYVPVSRVRQAMKEHTLEELSAEPVPVPRLSVRRLSKPEAAGRAEFLDGSPEEVAAQLVSILMERGLVR